MGNKRLLNILILSGLFLGGLFGAFLYDASWSSSMPLAEHSSHQMLTILEILGSDIFMNLLKMMILPLVATSIIAAVGSLSSFSALSKIGSYTLLYYFSTMFVAVCLGLFLVNLIEPGAGLGADIGGELFAAGEESFAKKNISAVASGGLFAIFQNLIQQLVPSNIFSSLANGDILPIIVFSMFFGAIIVKTQATKVSELFKQLFAVFMVMVDAVLWLAPIGVFSLIATTVAKFGWEEAASSLGFYMLTVVLGLFIHASVILPSVLWFFNKENPFSFLLKMKEAILTAFSTASSSATLPVTMECVTQRANVKKQTAGLVLPLGATVNMDGTALYEAVAVVFLAQAFGVQLGFPEMVLIAFTATIAAMGAASIPSAGLVTMVVVIDATNQSLLSINPAAALIPVSAIGIIIGVDRILDMCRTSVNLWGDCVGAKIIDRFVK